MTDDFTTTASERFKAYNYFKAFYRDQEKALDRLGRALGYLQSKALVDVLCDYGTSLDDCWCNDWKYRLAPNRAYEGICKHIMCFVMLEWIHAQRIKGDQTVQQPVRYEPVKEMA